MKLAACVCARGVRWPPWGAPSGLGPPPHRDPVYLPPQWLGRAGWPMAVCGMPPPPAPPDPARAGTQGHRGPSPIKSSRPQMIFPRCVLEHLPPLPQGLLSHGGGRRGLTGPPPSPGGDQPAPASLESGPRLPGTPEAEDEGSEAASGGGVDGAPKDGLLPLFLPLELRGGLVGRRTEWSWGFREAAHLRRS